MSVVQQWTCLSSSQVDFSGVPQVCFLGSSHFLCVMDGSHPTVHCSGQGCTELSLHEPYREPTSVRILSILLKHKQTSQEAALCASPMQRTVQGNRARLQNQAYSKEVTSLLASSGASILSLMPQSQTDIAKHKNKQRGFWAHQHLSCLFRGKMIKNSMFASTACQLILRKLLHFSSLYLALFLGPLD